ncbi:hypothetical protein GOP47_0011695 [Adiantum capillus-veneris]|uniref:Uncharacterized protein n=1 Tax=Adiantum capillus-veneris TaxID=13818 RepID=A0A9D4UTP9_ADICA|nr:hypothetical protein GOP47_0011695 [Adiantum capillus-veneris]
MVAQGNRPHVVIFPYDEHGHVTPSFALGRALTRVGIQVTGVLTATRYARVASIASEDRTPHFDIVAIPDSAEAGSSKQDDVCYQQSLQHLEPGLEELMLRLQPRSSCLMSDILFPCPLRKGSSSLLTRDGDRVSGFHSGPAEAVQASRCTK